MPRRIPRQLLPHSAVVTLARGVGPTGLVYESKPLEPRRAQFDGAGGMVGRQVQIGGADRVVVGRVFLDPMHLPIGSLVRSSVTGDELLVAEVRTWDGGGLRYLQVTLAQ